MDRVWAIPNCSTMVTVFFYFLALSVKCGGLDSFSGYLRFHVPKEHFNKDRHLCVMQDWNRKNRMVKEYNLLWLLENYL
ncbi:hypothetical protein Gohar_003741 [Gossypium harknessii]|uniref:Uncharacterized protein n=1 Tax=Gossypium harknessii TaxID=34285 RepID=A0A7J9I9B9_9ROSI|nr:hypothetical protein [Gossypium harknessii]